MNSAIKSARRVIEIFEYFAERRTGATAVEIRRNLGYPQSSTSTLLHSLLSLGYLTYDERSRMFRPTLRVALLGEWIVEGLGQDASPPAIMRRLLAETGDTVVLGTQNDTDVVYVHVLQATNPIRFFMKPGVRRPICLTATGRALLGLQTDEQIRLLVRRINAEQVQGGARIVEREVLDAVRLGRALGYCFTMGTATPGAGVVAVPLSGAENAVTLAIGIGGPVDRIATELDRYVRLLREAQDLIDTAKAAVNAGGSTS